MLKGRCSECGILAGGDDEVVFESEHWRVALAADQAYLGRSYVSLREHRASLSGLTAEQWLELHSVISRYESTVKRAFGANLFNWVCLMNNTFKEAVPTPHVHWHVRPRYGIVPVLRGIEYPDPDFGSHYSRTVHREVDRVELGRIGAVLREVL